MTRPASVHTGWCAADHQCGTGEHRADPIVVDLPNLGRALLVRVRSADGREHAEIRLSVALADVEPVARYQLMTLLGDLRTALHRATCAIRPSPRPRRTAG
jgi:hypothetical protein